MAPLSYGFALNLARPLQQRYGALPVLLRALAVALLLTAPLGARALARRALAARRRAVAARARRARHRRAFVLMALAAGRFGATPPVDGFPDAPVALALGLVVRGEPVAPVSIPGGAVCIAGAWLIRRASAPAASPAPLAASRPVPLPLVARRSSRR